MDETGPAAMMPRGRFFYQSHGQPGGESMMRDSRIPVSALRPVAIQFDEDLYQLAVWLLKHDLHNSAGSATHRRTVQGVATAYEYLTSVPREEVLAHVQRLQLSLGATVEPE